LERAKELRDVCVSNLSFVRKTKGSEGTKKPKNLLRKGRKKAEIRIKVLSTTKRGTNEWDAEEDKRKASCLGKGLH